MGGYDSDVAMKHMLIESCRKSRRTEFAPPRTESNFQQSVLQLSTFNRLLKVELSTFNFQQNLLKVRNFQQDSVCRQHTSISFSGSPASQFVNGQTHKWMNSSM
jgi:hypothetical protein